MLSSSDATAAARPFWMRAVLMSMSSLSWLVSYSSKLSRPLRILEKREGQKKNAENFMTRWSDDSACVCTWQSSSELSRPLHILHKLFLRIRFDAEAGALCSRRAFLEAGLHNMLWGLWDCLTWAVHWEGSFRQKHTEKRLRKVVLKENLVSPQDGLSSGWSLLKVVSPQGGLSSRWSLIWMVYHQGGLSSLTFSLHRFHWANYRARLFSVCCSFSLVQVVLTSV